MQFTSINLGAVAANAQRCMCNKFLPASQAKSKSSATLTANGNNMQKQAAAYRHSNWQQLICCHAAVALCCWRLLYVVAYSSEN